TLSKATCEYKQDCCTLSKCQVIAMIATEASNANGLSAMWAWRKLDDLGDDNQPSSCKLHKLRKAQPTPQIQPEHVAHNAYARVHDESLAKAQSILCYIMLNLQVLVCGEPVD